MLFSGLTIAEILARVLALGVGFTVHEYAHAWSAYQLGDDTAARQGRLSLDPRVHIDPMGALLLLVAGFGWARPVPIDPYRLGRQGTLLVALAGPVSNIVLAALAAIPARLMYATGVGGFGLDLLLSFAAINVLLAIFNMMPVAPLDGWRVLMGLVPSSTAFRLQSWERYGFVVLVLLLFTDVFWLVARPPMQLLLRLLLGPEIVG